MPFAVLSLAAVEKAPPNAYLARDAVSLSCERPVAGESSFALDAWTVSTMVEICRHLDGLRAVVERAVGRPAAEMSFPVAAALSEEGDGASPPVHARVGVDRRVHERSDLLGQSGGFATSREAAEIVPLASLLVSCLCRIAATTSDATSAESLVAEALGLAQRAGDKVGEAVAFGLIAELTWRRGDPRGAMLRHCRALELGAAAGDTAVIAASLQALAHLAAGESNFKVSAHLFGAADGLRERRGVATRSLVAEEHQAATKAARGALGEQAFEAEWRAGATLSIDAAVTYAIRNCARKGVSEPAGWRALTPKERRVTELVAEGFTNSRIAAALGMKQSTVSTHLRHVFNKLGVQNRSAIAARVYGRPVSAPPSEGAEARIFDEQRSVFANHT